MNNFSVLAISASIGGFIGALASSLLKYYFDNRYKHDKSKKITENVLKFIEEEINNNLHHAEKLEERPPYTFLNIKGLELIFSKIENLTLNKEHLTKIINMYFSFAILNDRIVAYRNKNLPPGTHIKDQKNICAKNIKKYQKNYLINGSIVEETK